MKKKVFRERQKLNEIEEAKKEKKVTKRGTKNVKSDK